MNENARAVYNDEYTYFANCDLDSWELKYSLENDTNRFSWADSTNGKGVIYYMKDEWGNECPYDFKNIQFTDNSTNYYTFDVLVDSVHYDLSVAQTSKNCYGNTIKEYYTNASVFKLTLGRNIFKNTSLSSTCHSNTLENNCYNNTFENGCRINTFEAYCYNNTFGSYCCFNSFGNYCHHNSFGNNFQNNSLEDYCKNNTFDVACNNNTFDCYCQYNTFGNNFKYNTVGNNCLYNSFGNNCQSITVFDGVQYCNVTGGSQNHPVKNAQILNGTAGTSVQNKLTITFAQDTAYTQVAGLVDGTTRRIWIAEDTVTGPTSSANGNIALFDGTSGKIVKDSGLQISDLADMVETTWSELKTLKDGENLVPGKQYRITDYNTVVSEDLTDVSVAEHQFDIIVTALSETELDHRASAVQHEGDTYFSDCDLSKWQLWYDIENDTEKYEWALDDSSSGNGGAKGSIPEYAPEYIYSGDIETQLNKAGLSTVLVFQGIETITIKGTDIDCYVYGTSVQAGALEYEKIFLQEYPSAKSSIFGIDNKEGISSISAVDTVSSSTQPTNGTKIIAKSVTSGATAGILNKAGLSPELEFNGRTVMYKGQNCYSYGSSTQYTALAKDFHTVSNIIVTDGISPIAPKKASDPGTEVIILDDETADPIATVSQETVVVGGNSGGTGVIYRMIDEWGNDCPYDFKNIMFTDNSTNYYTFDVLVDSVHNDFSVAQTEKNCYGNTIKSFINKFVGNIYKYSLSRNIFRSTELSSPCHSNTLENGCNNNSFGNNCYGNTFGNDCQNNSIGGDGCHSNTFGNNCQGNTFGNGCSNNSFGNGCQNNSLGSSCSRNSFGNGCQNNSFGNYCQNNSFGNYYYTNTFGNYCQSITVFDNVQFCNVTGGTNSSPVKNAQILNGTKGTSASNKLTIAFGPNKSYTQVAGLVNGTDLRIWIAEDEVTGPTTATDNHIALFDGTTGKIIKDSGVAISDLSPDLATSVTYSELVTLKTGGNLVPGMQYRITDYTCTTTQTNTQSASNVFDIIVTADSGTELNENAHAAHHTGDTYFANCNLDAWELKYCLENDTNRFAWADSTNGKGVIYYMKDEFDNECPYDFKNIQFKRKLTNGSYDDQGTDTWCYTFNAYNFVMGVCEDSSTIVSNRSVTNLNVCCENRIESYLATQDTQSKFKLNDIVFLDISYDTMLLVMCYGNTIRSNCYNITFGSSCYGNTIGNSCYDITFGKNCQINSFGNYCRQNSFGDSCYRNTFGDSCYSNTFESSYYEGSFGSNCQNNTFGSSCYRNSFGSNCRNNTFGSSCQNNSFGNSCQYNTFGGYCQNITVFDGVQYCNVTSGTSSSPVKNAQILNGTRGADSSNKLTITFERNKDYTQIAGLVNGNALRIWIAKDTVTCPTMTTNNHIALFDGASGKIIKDSGVAISSLYTKPSTGIPSTDLAQAVQTSLGLADTALQSYTETDPVFNSSAAASITTGQINQWDAKVSANSGTLAIQKNGTQIGTFGANQATNETINIQVNELPTVSASDNGKILMVVNGAWSLVTPTSIYNGTSTPDSSLGNNGDLYIQTNS